MSNYIRNYNNQGDNNLHHNNLFKNYKYKQEIIVVESKTDKDFYKPFLEKIFEKEIFYSYIEPDSINDSNDSDKTKESNEKKESDETKEVIEGKFNGKKGVLKSSECCSEKTLYIADSDYDGKRNITNPDKSLVFTTGHSVENFFFYKGQGPNEDNLSLFFKNYFKKYCKSNELYLKFDECYKYFLERIKTFKRNTLRYYAFEYARIENRKKLGGPKKKDNNGKINGKEILNAVNIGINEELSSVEKYKRNEMEKLMQGKAAFIQNSGYLWLRGHDIFYFLTNYLILIQKKRSFFTCEVKQDKILSIANELCIPKTFVSYLEKSKKIEKRNN